MFLKQKLIVSILQLSALYLARQTLLCGCIFLGIMVNSCKGYSGSFSEVLLMCVVSAASLQIMVDHDRKQQENERFSVGVCAPYRLNRGLELNVCGVQKLFQFFFTSFTTAQKLAFSFPLFLTTKWHYIDF